MGFSFWLEEWTLFSHPLKRVHAMFGLTKGFPGSDSGLPQDDRQGAKARKRRLEQIDSDKDRKKKPA